MFSRIFPRLTKIVVAFVLLAVVYLGSNFWVSHPSFLSSFVSVNGNACGNIIGKAGNTYYILTAAHAVNKLFPNFVWRVEEPYSKYICKLSYIDNKTDFAILQFKSKKDLPVSRLSFKYKVMDEIITVGTPHGIPYWIAKGSIGYIGEKIYVTAANCHGSSGGPLYNANGQQIGVIVSVRLCDVYNSEYDIYFPIQSMVKCVSISEISRIIDQEKFTNFIGVKDEQY